MGLRLVDDDLDMSFDIPLTEEARRALSMQLQRVGGLTMKPGFEVRLCQRLQELIDVDLQPPSSRQIAYALAIAKALDVALSGEVLRHRGSMFEFLNRYAPLYKQRVGTNRGEVL